MSKGPFKLALNTSTIRCGEHPLARRIDAAAAAGWEGLEPWVKELDAHVAGGGALADIRTRCADGGLEIVNLIGFFEWAVDDPERRKLGFDEARRCFAMAAELGCRHVAAPPSGVHGAAGTDLRAVADRFAALFDAGAEFGVAPLVEYWGFAKTLGRAGEALQVAADCGRDGARILADVFHTYKGSGTFEAFRMLGDKALGLFHLNDYPALPARGEITDAERVYPGDGVAPLGAILRSLCDAGYRGYLSLELFNAAYWAGAPEAVARTGLEKARRVVATACAES